MEATREALYSVMPLRDWVALEEPEEALLVHPVELELPLRGMMAETRGQR